MGTILEGLGYVGSILELIADHSVVATVLGWIGSTMSWVSENFGGLMEFIGGLMG